MRVQYDVMVQEFARVLEKKGFTHEDAENAAIIFAQNSLAGVYSHGLNRFPRVVSYLEKGEIDPNLTEKQALMLKEAGLDRINHNLNSSRAYYHNICSTHTFEQRVANIKMLQGLGFEICSGGIIGMGESKEDVVDMLLELREIRPEALPINFLLPIPGTPLEHADMSALTTAYCMKVLCLARLLVPQSDIRCAAGREIYFKGEEKNLLRVVDSIFASGYLTAGGQGIKDTIQAIEDAGFTYEIESA